MIVIAFLCGVLYDAGSISYYVVSRTVGLLLTDESVRTGIEGVVDHSKYSSGISIELLRKAFDIFVNCN